MKFRAEFLSSFANIDLLPSDGRPEIAFIGRSNVGKSSLINALVEKKGLAKTSSTPGKTQLLNYFTINNSFYIVDMPGYGFAKAAKSARAEWGKVSEDYFKKRRELSAVGLLIDSRHQGLANDIEVVEWFSEQNIPFFLVLTKIDKLKQQELAAHEKMLRQSVFTSMAIFKTSSESKRGLHELQKFVLELTSTKKDRPEENPQLQSG